MSVVFYWDGGGARLGMGGEPGLGWGESHAWDGGGARLGNSVHDVCFRNTCACRAEMFLVAFVHVEMRNFLLNR